MNLTDAVDFEYPENEMIKPLKNITLSEADSTETFKFKPFEYERGVVTKTAKGVINTIRDMQDLPEQVKIFGKRLNYGFGAYFGDEPEEVNRKLQNLVTAERNLNEAQAERYKYTSGREAESLSYGVGGGIVNYGTMLLPAGAVGGALKVAGKTAKAVKGAEAAGLTTMGVMELAGQVQDKTPMKDGEIDVEAMTPEWARKATGGTIAYTGISALTEKYVGFGQQVRMWSKPIQWGGNITSKALTTLKTAGKNSLSEGMTEGIQDLEAAGIGLIDGTLTMDKLPARLQQAWKSAIIGSIIGGGVGTAAAMKSARNVKKQLREMVAPVVGEEDANTVAEAIYDAGTDDMTKAISIELELSSELKNKHGKVWNSMLAAVSREIEGKPRFMAMTEDERASYANTVAKHFADQVLAEANYRGTTLDAILSESDIVYDNGIKLKRHINLYDALKNPEMIPPETKLKRETLLAFLKRNGGVIDEGGDIKSRDAIKEYPGLINKKGMSLDDAALMAWEHGYFTGQERPTINDLLDAIDEGLRGHHRYNVEEEQTFNDAIIDLATELDRIGIDYDNMTAAEIEKAVDDYEQEMRDLPEKLSLQTEAEFYANNEPEIGMSEDEAERFAIETEGKEYPIIDEKYLPERYYQIAEENAKLDAENPAYEGETININGVDKTVYNSDGERIAQSEAALRNFYNWFGDSKVVDKQGRPLVVYHGTNKKFDTFDKSKIGKKHKNLYQGKGFYFTSEYYEAQGYGKRLMPVYLKIENPALSDYNIKPENDGISAAHGVWVAFEPNQIKSTSNRGTYSESENIYYQEGDEYEIKVATGDRTAVEEQKSKNAEYNKLAKEYYGTTNKLSETGYILTDGSLLDFSGKKFGGSPNNRSIDHREIVDALDKAGMEEFINSGNIRYLPEGDKILLSNEPTPQQYKVIERIINNNGGYITIELMNDANKWGMNRNDYYGEYEDTTFNKVKRDIKAFYTGEGVREITTFFQSAFHGTPFPELEGGSFKLEKIGTGENAQAHGYGLYYTASYDIADKRYRERLTKPYTWFISFGKVEYDKKSGKYKNAFNEKTLEFEVYKDFKLDANEDYDTLIKSYEQTKGFVDNTEEKIKIAKKYKDYFINGDIHNFSDESMATGQVYEVDLPENPYLLDEQKSYREQSDFVRQAIQEIDRELQYPERKEKIFDKREDAIDFYDSKIDEFEEKANGYQRFFPESFVTDDGKYGVKYVDDYTINDPLIGDDSEITGEGIYSRIARQLGSQKAASELLEKHGVKGITYFGRTDGRCFVIFNPEDVRVIQKFYQRGKNAKGFTQITPDEYIIKLLEDADESTLPHEFAHYWLTEMWNYTRTGRASEKYMKRWQIISDYLGIKPEQTRLTRGQQEKFASSYEAYLTRGDLPTPLIGSVFDDYDKWLQRVYSDYNRINYQSGFGKRRVRLTDAAIKFFQSMTTGTLEAPALAPKDTGVKLETEPQLPATTSNELIEDPAVSDTTIVTRGDKGVSKVYKRGALLHPEAVSQPGLSYDKMHLDEQALAAKQFVEKDLNKAREFIGGEKNETGKLSRTAVMLAYEQEMLRIGNLDEYDRVRKINAYESVRHGQEIAAQRIETDDVTNPAYWLEKAEHNLANQVAQKLFKGKERTKQLTETIKKETESLQKAITGKTVAEQQQIMRKTAERLKKEYGLDTLYQMPDDINDMTTQEFIKDVFGINLDEETRNDIINKQEQVRKLWENTIAKGGNPSVEAMRAKRELNDLIQAQTPSNALAIWTSIFGRGIMLTSVKSPVLNIISNIEAGFTEGITRRLMYGTTEKAVDKTVKEEFSKYAWEVYKASADIVTTMNDYDDDMRIIGEQILHSQGPGAFRAASRKVEEVSFKYLMGAPDAVAKTLAFNDTADLLATKIAKEEGAKDISKRATEIYKDAILIKPETEQGQLVRKQAQEQAHYTTFTNDSWAARFGLSARNWLNMVGRNKIRLGDLTMKFVKTPANVQMMGLEYGFGSLYTLYNVQEIIKNPQSETSQIAIRAAVRNGLGIALAALLYSMLDPDDYFSEFDTLNPKEKDRMRAMGAMPNSIKIGNKWVSIDYFGQLGIPLVGMLEARRNNGLRSYIQSGLTQAAKIPGIKETKQLIDNMSEYARYDLKPEKIAQMMAGTVLDQARAMTIPAIVNDIAKMTDDYERDTMGGVMDKVISSIPGLRQTLPERYGIQGLVRTEPELSTLLFGSRVKTEQSDKLVREVEKLAGKAEQPSISDVTKYGDLRLLSPEKKVKVRKEFYKAYNAESKKLISTREYQKKSPEDKKKALNKVRSRVVKSLKEKYNNDIQREKRRR